MRIRNLSKIVLICLIFIVIPIIVSADQELFIPEYTEDYKRWLELSEEEKANYIEPQAYELIEDNTEDLIQPFSMQADTDELLASNLQSKYIRPYYGNVKNQSSSNACWGYSAATVFDTNYYLTTYRKKQFSNLHMDYITSRTYNSNGFNRAFNSGGNMLVALAYATNGMGIALESNMPSTINTNTIKNVPVNAKVSDYILLKNINEVKNYIYQYGVVSAYTYSSGSAYFSSNNLYNNNDLAYCCTYSDVLANKIVANHAITLIGWDDNYTNIAFPGKKGAYVALNSYGSNFGKNGVYYIFYDDYFVNKSLIGVKKTDDIDYNYIYQHDTYGYTTVSGYKNISNYAANVFTRKLSGYSEKLKKISVYVPDKGSITVYINANGKDVKISSATKKITTYISEPGYHTIELSQPIELKNKQFAVGIKYVEMLGMEIPIAGSYYSTVTSNFGESYLSDDGINYIDMKTIFTKAGYNHANACIKAFTDKGTILKTTKVSNNTQVINYNEYKSDLENYVFDYKYYADHNLDLYKVFGYNQEDLKNHWKYYGQAEGRPSSSVFNVKYYIDNNIDLKKVLGYNYVAAYNHFINYGYAEYRKSSPEYDGSYYRQNNVDLSQMTSMQLIRHYSLCGKNELRIASKNYDISNFLFDSSVYAECNPDVVNAFGNNPNLLKQHWNIYGISEGRIASFIFDAKWYLKNYTDLKKAFGNNYLFAYYHFINNGFFEGRQGSPVFSVQYYLSKNGDLKKVFGNNYLCIMNHFNSYGIKEKRLASRYFNVTTYRLKNADLKNIFREDYTKYYLHYLTYGKNERRVCI